MNKDLWNRERCVFKPRNPLLENEISRHWLLKVSFELDFDLAVDRAWPSKVTRKNIKNEKKKHLDKKGKKTEVRFEARRGSKSTWKAGQSVTILFYKRNVAAKQTESFLKTKAQNRSKVDSWELSFSFSTKKKTTNQKRKTSKKKNENKTQRVWAQNKLRFLNFKFCKIDVLKGMLNKKRKYKNEKELGTKNIENRLFSQMKKEELEPKTKKRSFVPMWDP